jgi:uncharacterized protein (TIGR02246 family)
MRRLLLAMFVVPSLALASHHEKAHHEKAEKAAAPSASSEDPMAAWVPPKVKNEAKDKQEIQGLFKAMEAAARTGDLDAAAALVDFPVTMLTDDSKGEAMGDAWSREQWTQVMKPFYDTPMKDMKVTHKPTIFLLSDSLASVDDVCTMTKGGKTITSRNSMFVVRKDGKWRVKAMAEGGWGDMMAAAPATAGAEQGAASQGTGSAAEPPGSQGTGSGAMGAGSQGTGSAAEPSGSQGTGSGAMGSGSQGSGAAVDPQGAGTGTVSEPPGTPGTGSGATGSGSQGTGTPAEPPGSQGSGSATTPK